MGLDYYAILDVQRTAKTRDIKVSYRKLALRLHPLRKTYPQHPPGPPEGVVNLPLPSLPEETYWEILNEAYDVLSNRLSREVYDQFGEEGLKKGVAAPGGYIAPYTYHGDYMRTYSEFFGSDSPYADLIDAVMNPPTLYTVKEGTGVKHKDPTIEHFLELSLEEVFHGGVKQAKIVRHEFLDELKEETEKREVLISVPFPPGILEETRLLFPEARDQSLTRTAADIAFIVCVKKHKTFRRDKWDLHMDHEITLKQALIGFMMVVDTLDDRKLKILITDVVE